MKGDNYFDLTKQLMPSPSELLSCCIIVGCGKERSEEKPGDAKTNNAVRSGVCNGNRIGGSANADLLGMTNH